MDVTSPRQTAAGPGFVLILEQPAFGLNPFLPRPRGVLRIQAPPFSAPLNIRLCKYMVRIRSTHVLYVWARRAAPPGVKGLSVRHARKVHPRPRGVLGIQAPPPSACAIIQLYI